MKILIASDSECSESVPPVWNRTCLRDISLTDIYSINDESKTNTNVSLKQTKDIDRRNIDKDDG